jgi:hypothetical protein
MSGSPSQRPSDLIYEIAVHQSQSRHSSSQKMSTHPKYNSRTTRQSPSRLLAQTTCSSACTAPGPRSTFFRRAFSLLPSPYLDIADSRSGGCHTTVDTAISGKVPDTAPASVRARRRVCTSSSPSPSPIPNPPSSELSEDASCMGECGVCGDECHLLQPTTTGEPPKPNPDLWNPRDTDPGAKGGVGGPRHEGCASLP